MQCPSTILKNQSCATLFFAVMAALALGIAWTSQYVYGLQPCELCHLQRIPFMIVVVVGVAGFILSRRSPKQRPWIFALIAVTFLANSLIAGYHTGVERKWWPSFLEGCSVPEMKGDITDVLAKIAATPAVRCDEIPWTDPILGLSMANYNVLFCLGLCILALYALKKSSNI